MRREGGIERYTGRNDGVMSHEVMREVPDGPSSRLDAPYVERGAKVVLVSH